MMTNRHRWWVAGALAIGTLVHQAPPAAADNDVRLVVTLGDSLTVAAADEHAAIATFDGYLAVDLAFRGASMIHWQPAADAVADADADADAVVLALGTNDAAYAAWVDPVPYWTDALDALDGECVVVVAWQRHNAADEALWARLLPELEAHSVHVYDWHTPATAAPWVLGPDGVHHSPAGELAYGWALDAAQEMCP